MSFRNRDTDYENCDSIGTSFNNILQDCARLSAKYLTKKPNLKSRRRKLTPLFSESCIDLRNTKQYENFVNHLFNSKL